VLSLLVWFITALSFGPSPYPSADVNKTTNFPEPNSKFKIALETKRTLVSKSQILIHSRLITARVWIAVTKLGRLQNGLMFKWNYPFCIKIQVAFDILLQNSFCLLDAGSDTDL